MKWYKLFLIVAVVSGLIGCQSNENNTPSKSQGDKNISEEKNESNANHELSNIHLPKSVAGFELDKQPMIGSPKPKVTLVVGVDYNNPNYRKWAEVEYPKLLKQYLFTSKVKIYFMNAPSKELPSLEAALAAETVFMQGRMQFDVFQNVLLQVIKDEEANDPNFTLSREFLDKYLGYGNEIGWDSSVAQKDFEGKAALDSLAIDLAICKSKKISNSPAVFVNEKLVSSSNGLYPTFEEIEQYILKAEKE